MKKICIEHFVFIFQIPNVRLGIQYDHLKNIIKYKRTLFTIDNFNFLFTSSRYLLLTLICIAVFRSSACIH